MPVTLSVRLGTTTVSMTARFYYLPVFQGEAVLKGIPGDLFPQTTSRLRVRLTNVPLIEDRTNPAQVLATERLLY